MKSRFSVRFNRLGQFIAASGLISFITISALLCQSAVAAESDLVSREAAHRAGLETHWFTAVRVHPAHGGIAYVTQHVNERDVTTIFRIEGGLRTEIISETDLNQFGEPYGIEGAKTAAETRMGVLKTEGWDAKVVQVVKPKITFYVVTDNSVVQAIDGETGATQWATRVGETSNAPQQVAATNDMVVAVNGSIVYFLDAKTGFIEWSRPADAATGAGAVISNRYAFVPLMIGEMEAFPLWDAKAPTITFATVGRNFVHPIATDRSVAWPNDRGQLNVAFSNRVEGVGYRFDTGLEIDAPPAVLQSRYLVTAVSDGHVHCIQESNGRVLWRATTGERIRNQPFAYGDAVYVTSILGTLIKVGHPLGDVKWRTEGVSAVLATNGEKLFCKGMEREIVVVDMATGSIVNRVFTADFDFHFTNFQTDRILVGRRNGLIQCLRMTELEYPMLHVAGDTSDPATDEEMDIPETNEEGERNPFRRGR